MPREYAELSDPNDGQSFTTTIAFWDLCALAPSSFQPALRFLLFGIYAPINSTNMVFPIVFTLRCWIYAPVPSANLSIYVRWPRVPFAGFMHLRTVPAARGTSKAFPVMFIIRCQIYAPVPWVITLRQKRLPDLCARSHEVPDSRARASNMFIGRARRQQG